MGYNRGKLLFTGVKFNNITYGVIAIAVNKNNNKSGKRNSRV